MRLAPTRTVFENLWSDGRGWILVFVALGWMFSVGSRYIFPVMFPHLRDVFGLSLGQLGAYYTLLWVAYASLQFAGGMLADRYGERNVLVFSTLMTGGTMLAVGLTFTSGLLAVGMVTFGFASALYGTTRYTVLVDIYPTYDSTAVGITQSAGEAGNTLLPVVAGFLAAYGTWRLGFAYVLPFFLIVGAGLWTIVPRRTSGESSAIDEISVDTFRYVLLNVRSRETLTLTAILTLTMFVIQGVSTFYPTYLVDVKGLSPTTAALMFSLLFISAGVVMPISGALADAFSARGTLVLVIGTTTVTLLLFPFVVGLPQIAIVTVLFTSVYGVLTVAVTQLANTLPSDMRGTGLGFLRTGYILLAAPGSYVVGMLADADLFDESFFLLMVPATAAVALALLLDT